MKRVVLEAEGFTGRYNHLNGIRTLKFNNLDLIRANICIGYSSWKSILLRTPRKYLESLYNAVGTIAYTKTEQGNLALAENFYDLDMSEKSPITYRLGMTITKLVAERELNIPWLLHVDKLVKEGIASITSGTNERGDLAGLDINNIWHVLESKGRSNQPSPADIQKGKSQAGRITTINGKTPATKNVCVSYLKKSNTYTHLIDPPNGRDHQPTSWEIDPDKFILFYYNEFLSQLSNQINNYFQVTIGNSTYEFNIYESGFKEIKIGVMSKIVNHINEESTDFIESLREYQKNIIELNRTIHEDISPNSYGLDGIILLG